MTTDGKTGDMTVRTPTLSVTYGAFSLTLEGFEDPFATMRDVAEYFRTVLAEDRAFGNRAAAPRAEALRRFAEDRFGRPVDARAAGDRVHLRAGVKAPVRLRAVPDAAALFDEEAAEAPAPAGDAASRDAVSRDAAPDADPPDPLSAALDEPRADALPPSDAARSDAAQSDPAQSDPAQNDAASGESRPPEAGRRGAMPAGADDAAVDRLISKADSALAGADAQRRRATFAQLKAAVAATRAEADAGTARRPPGQKAAEIARYRDDLAQSVGRTAEPPAPRRGARTEPGTGAPAPATPPVASPGAPLILAAEQRVTGTGGAVSPRRVVPETLTIEALFDEDPDDAAPATDRSAFARFLAEVEPADLTQHLDAAAAWLSHGEGLEDFPRLQLMRLVAGSEGAQDREAVMRSIGILLREGRLRRSRRGQFESGTRSVYAAAAQRFAKMG